MKLIHVSKLHWYSDSYIHHVGYGYNNNNYPIIYVQQREEQGLPYGDPLEGLSSRPPQRKNTGHPYRHRGSGQGSENSDVACERSHSWVPPTRLAINQGAQRVTPVMVIKEFLIINSVIYTVLVMCPRGDGNCKNYIHIYIYMVFSIGSIGYRQHLSMCSMWQRSMWKCEKTRVK